MRGQPVWLTTNEWLKAGQLGETYWLYLVRDPLEPGAEPAYVQDPARALGYAPRGVRSVGYNEVPVEAVLVQARSEEE